MKKGIAIGIIALFIVSAVSPMVIGYEADAVSEIAEEVEPKTTVASGPMDSSWPMYQHDAANTGFSSSPFPDSLNLSYNLSYSEIINYTFWSFQSSPIVANGKIFIAGGGWKFETDIIALDENNGSLIWETDLPLNYSSTSFIISNSPVVSNGKVFVCYGSLWSFPPQTRIFALDENTGEIIWEKRIFTSAAYPSITVSNDKVIVGGHFTNILPISRLYVFDANSGDLIWNNKMRGYFESTPVVSNNTVFTTTSSISPMTMGFNTPLFFKGVRVYAFDLNDGSKIWEVRVKGHIILSSPAISNGKLLVPSTIMGLFRCDRRVTSLDVKTGEEIWHHHIKQNRLNSAWPTSISTPSVAYGKIFINDASGFIFVLDEETGEMIWKREIIEEIKGFSMCTTRPPVIADHKVITASMEFNNSFEISKICIFNVSDGEKIWSVDGPLKFMTPFAIANGKLFVNDNNSIYVYS